MAETPFDSNTPQPPQPPAHTPPPAPQQPFPTGNEPENAGLKFAKQAASASAAMPLFVLAVACVSNIGTNSDSNTSSIYFGCINLIAVVLGFALGVFALVRMAKYGAKGILAKGIIGVVLNGLLLAGVVVFLITVRNIASTRSSDPALEQQITGTWWTDYVPETGVPAYYIRLADDKTFEMLAVADQDIYFAGTWSARNNTLTTLVTEKSDSNPTQLNSRIEAKVTIIGPDRIRLEFIDLNAVFNRLSDNATPLDQLAAAEESRTAFDQFHTWIGGFEVDSQSMTIISHDQRSNLGIALSGAIQPTPVIVQLIATNETENETLVIDPLQAALFAGDEQIAQSLSADQMNVDRNHPEFQTIQPYLGPLTIRPGEAQKWCLLLFGHDVDLSRVTELMVTINDEQYLISGEWLSPEELASRNSESP